MYVMLEPSNHLLEALEGYKTSLRRLNKRHPTIKGSEDKCQQAYETLLTAFRDERFRLPVQRVFDTLDDFDVGELARNSEFLSIEAAVLNRIEGTGKGEAKLFVARLLSELGHNQDREINSVDLFIAQLIAFHKDFMNNYRATRAAERTEKKKRRRDLTVNAGYFCSGMAIVTGNVFAVIPAPFVAPSVGLGSGAMLKGFWDMVRVV